MNNVEYDFHPDNRGDNDPEVPYERPEITELGEVRVITTKSFATVLTA